MGKMDPGYFYSSVAQSAAAIVRLLATVFVSRLLPQLASLREQREEVIDDYVRCTNNMRDTQYALGGALDVCKQEISKVEAGTGSQVYLYNADWAAGSSAPGLTTVTPDVLKELKRQARILQSIINLLEPAKHLSTLESFDQHVAAIAIAYDKSRKPRYYKQDDPFTTPPRPFQRRLEPLLALQKSYARYKANAFPRYTWLILAAIGWLTFGSIFLPLIFLNADCLS